MRDRFEDDLLDGAAERAIWRDLEGLRASGTVRETRRFLAEQGARRNRSVRWLPVWRVAIPATAMAAAAVAALVFLPVDPPGMLLSTRVGEMRREALADGTVVLLNTDSRVRVTYRDHARDVTLIAGEARFDVAHDTARPFRVTAGAMSVTAVGTAFDVVALPSRTAVTLIDGRVLVRADANSGPPSSPRLLRPGQQIALVGGRMTPPRTARLDAALAWQRSYIDVDDMALDEALAEVNRYSTTKILVDAPGLRDARIGGVFKAGDTEAVVGTLCAYFGLVVRSRQPDRIVLGRAIS